MAAALERNPGLSSFSSVFRLFSSRQRRHHIYLEVPTSENCSSAKRKKAALLAGKRKKKGEFGRWREQSGSFSPHLELLRRQPVEVRVHGGGDVRRGIAGARHGRQRGERRDEEADEGGLHSFSPFFECGVVVFSAADVSAHNFQEFNAAVAPLVPRIPPLLSAASARAQSTSSVPRRERRASPR